MTDRQNSNPSVPYDTFACFAGLIKISILGVIFLVGLGGGGLDCGQYQILTDPRNGLKNLCMQFGNDRSHRLGGV